VDSGSAVNADSWRSSIGVAVARRGEGRRRGQSGPAPALARAGLGQGQVDEVRCVQVGHGPRGLAGKARGSLTRKACPHWVHSRGGLGMRELSAVSVSLTAASSGWVSEGGGAGRSRSRALRRLSNWWRRAGCHRP